MVEPRGGASPEDSGAGGQGGGFFRRVESWPQNVGWEHRFRGDVSGPNLLNQFQGTACESDRPLPPILRNGSTSHHHVGRSEDGGVDIRGAPLL